MLDKPDEFVLYACYKHDFKRVDGEIIQLYGFDILRVHEYDFGTMKLGLINAMAGRGEITSLRDLAQYLWHSRRMLESRGKKIKGVASLVTSIALQIAKNPQRLSRDDSGYLDAILNWD
tara:strand:- start:867 stop:1223 length:357 start_codon:yes stop_codon:yes gene_type:complete